MDIKKYGPSALKYGIKAAGAAGIGVVLVDAHKAGRHWANIQANKSNANAADYWFENSRNMAQPSWVNSKLKDKIFKMETRNNLRGFFAAGVGYVKGFVGSLVNDIVPLGVSIAALATKSKIGQYISGGALALYSAYAFGKNVLGFGVSDDNNRFEK